MRIAIDTNRYRDLAGGHAEVRAVVERAEQVYVPFVVAGELRAGFAIGSRGRANERVLRRFLGKPGVDLLFADESTTRAYAALFRQLRAQGTPVPTNDLWIAALAVQHDLELLTRDRHFARLPQLAIVEV